MAVGDIVDHKQTTPQQQSTLPRSLRGLNMLDRPGWTPRPPVSYPRCLHLLSAPSSQFAAT